MGGASQPSGTVTLVFTDIEGSTNLLHELGTAAYKEALAEHRTIVREAFARYSGYEVDYEGDAFFYAFSSAKDAVSAVSEAMESLADGPISIRVGIHSGEPELDPPKYVGMDVHTAARIMAAGHGGQVVVSPATAALLPEGASLVDLGEHRFKDLTAPKRIYQLGAGDFPPLKTLYHTNLPIPATPFVGRGRELEDVTAFLQNGARIVTLTGPGGTGKTRLALQAAAEASDRFSDGVYWVPLAPLRDASLVLPTVAQCLSVRERAGASALDALCEHVDGKRLLVLLDNCEQVITAAPELAELAGRTSGLKLLVTSRETLRIQGELEYPVPELASEEAVALFCERARCEPSRTIADLCAQLDNLPLAIELAAARLKLLTAEQLLERLGSRLDLLKGGRDADPRQQTLRATIDWSYDLLTPREQELFRRLSVFRGGCTLEAAEAVCEADLDTLESLLDKSLLRRREADLVPRFWMLETIREFANERLLAAAELDRLLDRHAGYFLALAEELEPPLMGIDELSVGRLSPETDNLRAAIETFGAQEDDASLARLIGALFRFWETQGLVREGHRRAREVLEDGACAPPPIRAKVLYAASICAYHEGDLDACVVYDEERLALARAEGDLHASAVALSDLAMNARDIGQLDTAATMLEEARSLAVDAGTDETVWALTGNLADLLLIRSDHCAVLELLEPQRLVVKERGSQFGVAMTCQPLGWAALGLGDLDLAEERFTEALDAANRAAGLVYASRSLDGLGCVAGARGRWGRAARILGAAEGLRSEAGIRSDVYEEGRVTAIAEAGGIALGSSAWDALISEGSALTWEEAVAYALEDASDRFDPRA
jgi:predicted ATPase